MHIEIRNFLQEVKAKYPVYFKDKKVLEAGSLNLNGSPREYFEYDVLGKGSYAYRDYTGVDIGSGNGVDLIMPVHELVAPIEGDSVGYDVVVSTEMLEHDVHWQKSLSRMVGLVKPGGLLLITCAGPKRPEHGTKATDIFSSPYTTDYYRNISVQDFIEFVPRVDFTDYVISYGRGGEDLLFYGIRRKVGEAAVSSPLKEIAPCNTCPLPVTVCIPTKNRYDSLALCLISIAFQTRVPRELYIVDDSDEPQDMRNIPNLFYALKLLNARGVDWKVRFGEKKGQHYSHETIQNLAQYDLIFRIDDDEIAEPNVLSHLYDLMTEGVGAVGCSVLMPDPQPLPSGLENKISVEMSAPNVQWFMFKGIKEAEHLYSCFMYRKGIVNYELSLSPVCHREETLFSHSLFKKGLKLLITGGVKVWHFRANEGGIRTFRDPALWEHDEKIFRDKLLEWGTLGDGKKVIVLDSGIGDHFALKSVLPEILVKYPDVVIASCFPDVFWDMPDIKQISIAEAKLTYGNIDRFQIYQFMERKNWKSNLPSAFKEMYLK